MEAMSQLMAEAAKEAARQTSTSKFEKFQHQYAYKPDAFVHDCICFDGLPYAGPTAYQDEILQLLIDKKRIAVRGPHGCGKTGLAAWVTLWAVLTGDDIKVPTTASAWRHLTKFLWPEIHKWAPRIRWHMLGIQPFDSNQLMKRALQRLPTCEAFAVASNNAAFIEGAHAVRIVYIYDESKEIPDPTWDATEGAFASAGPDTNQEAYAFAISTPGRPQGRFYDIHQRKRGYEDWHAYHITLDMAVKAGTISRHWADQRKRQWGEQNPLYQNRVLGEFAESAEDVVIPLSWVEAANERWLEWADTGRVLPDAMRELGVDIARYGDDISCIAERVGHILTEIEKWQHSGLMASAGRIKSALGDGYAKIDVIGVGAGVVDRLLEQECNVTGIDFRAATDRTDLTGLTEMHNVRAAAWWNMRELLDPDSEEEPILLPPDDDLINDLTTPTYDYTSRGSLMIESKKNIKKRLGHSPDVGDAAVIAFWDEEQGWAWRA
jgi:hypothetical protein